METAEVFRKLKEKTKNYFEEEYKENEHSLELIKKIEFVRDFGKRDFYKNEAKDKEFFATAREIVKYYNGKLQEITNRESVTCGAFEGHLKAMELAYKKNKRNALAELKTILNTTIDPLLLIVERLTKDVKSSYNQERTRFNYISNKGFTLPMPDMAKTITDLSELVYISDVKNNKIYNLIGLAIKYNAKYYRNNKKEQEKLSKEDQEKMNACIALDEMFNKDGEVVACENVQSIADNLNVLFNLNIFSPEFNKIRYNTLLPIGEHFIAYYFGKLLKANINQEDKEESMKTSFIKQPKVMVKDKAGLEKRSKALAQLKEYFEDDEIIKACNLATFTKLLDDTELEDAYKSSILKKMRIFLSKQQNNEIPSIVSQPYQIELYKEALKRKEESEIASLIEDVKTADEMYKETSGLDQVIVYSELSVIFSKLAIELQIDEDVLKLKLQKGEK